MPGIRANLRFNKLLLMVGLIFGRLAILASQQRNRNRKSRDMTPSESSIQHAFENGLWQIGERNMHQAGTGGGEPFPDFTQQELDIERDFLLKVATHGKIYL